MTDHDLYPCPPGSRSSQYGLFMDALRDRFAAAALTGMLANSSDQPLTIDAQLWAHSAYAFAEAMLAQRSQPTGAPAPQPGEQASPTKGQ